MTTLFYLSTILFIAYELCVVTNPLFFSTIAEPFKKYIQDKAITFDLINAFIAFIVGILYFLWSIIGLFTANNKLFLILLLLGIVTPVIKKLIFKNSPIITAIDGFISIIILCTILLNHFL